MPTESKGEVSLEGSRRNGSDKLDVVEGINLPASLEAPPLSSLPALVMSR